MKSILAGCLFLFSISLASAQSAGDYRSVGGDWNSSSSWERFDGAVWVASPPVPGAADGVITIIAGTTIDVTSAVIANQIVVEGDALLNIQNGGTLTLSNSGGLDLDILAADFATSFSDGLVTVFSGGSLINQSVTPIGSTTSNLIFDGPSEPAPATGGGVYQHGANVNLPQATWRRGTTCNVTGITNIVPANLDQPFWHFQWNCVQSTTISLGGALASIDGDFTIANTNNQFLNLGFIAAGTGQTDVGGNLTVSGTSKLIVSSLGNYDLNVAGNVSISSLPLNTNNFPLFGSSSGIVTMDVAGNFTFNSSAARTLRFTTTGSFILTVGGTTTVSSGNTIDLAAGAGTGRLVLQGDFVNNGVVTESVSSTTSRIDFSDIGTQTVSGTGTVTQTVGYQVASTSILDLGTYALGGLGNFTNNGRIIVRSSDAAGAIQANTTNGNIRVPVLNRTWTANSTIEYGTGAVAIGNGHPSTGTVHTVINASGGISIATGSALVTNNLTLTLGNLNVGDQSLTIHGVLSAATNISIGTAGSLTLNGSSTYGIFPFASGSTPSFANFTLDNPNGVTFNNSVTITGVTNLVEGVLSFPARTLTLSGTFAPGGSGAIAPSSTSTLAITGSGAFGTLRVDNTNNSVGTFTFSRASSGTASLNSTLIVVNTFNLNNGILTNTNGLQMANGSTLFRGANGSLAGSAPTDLPANQSYNVHYTGGVTTGLELPGTTDDPGKLGTLTINGAVVLDKNITVNGNVNIASSTLSANGFNITLASPNGFWNKTNGSFAGGTGSLIITGNITVTYTATPPTWSNVSTQAGATLTMPAAAFITGNFQLDASSTFNHSNGTITFNGASGDQTLSAAGKTFNNVSVNKAGGQLLLTPTLNLLGTFSVVSATTVQSNGSLVLVSTTDGTTGNASIGQLASGASIVGNVTVQRAMSAEGRRYRDISSPVQTATVAQIMSSGITVTGFTGSSFPCGGCANNNASMYSYNESVAGPLSNGYVAVTSASTQLTPGRGYNVLVRNEVGAATMALTGPINSGSFSYPGLLTYTNSGDPGDGWNFVGNPYPATIDWDNGWTKSNIQGNMISVYDASISNYRTWNGSVGSLSGGVVATGQGFWIQAAGANPTLTITEASKTGTGTFYRTKDEEIHYLELIIAGNDTEDRAYLQLVEGSTGEFDAMDGTKLSFDGLSFSSITSDKKVAINALGEIPTEGNIQLDLSNAKPGQYLISSSAFGDFDGVVVALFDQFENKTYPLTGTPISISITDAEGSKDSERFLLVFGESMVTGVEETLVQLVQVYPNPVVGEVSTIVKSESQPSGEALDNLGKSIGSFVWSKEEGGTWKGTLDMSTNRAGIYFARIKFDAKERVVKLVKR